MFQLYAIDKRTNRVHSLVGSADTYRRCQNFKRAYDGTYQPVCWFAVFEAGMSIGDQVPAT